MKTGVKGLLISRGFYLFHYLYIICLVFNFSIRSFAPSQSSRLHLQSIPKHLPPSATVNNSLTLCNNTQCEIYESNDTQSFPDLWKLQPHNVPSPLATWRPIVSARDQSWVNQLGTINLSKEALLFHYKNK